MGLSSFPSHLLQLVKNLYRKMLKMDLSTFCAHFFIYSWVLPELQQALSEQTEFDVPKGCSRSQSSVYPGMELRVYGEVFVIHCTWPTKIPLTWCSKNKNILQPVVTCRYRLLIHYYHVFLKLKILRSVLHSEKGIENKRWTYKNWHVNRKSNSKKT